MKPDKQEEKCSKHEWYPSKKYSRSIILTIVFTTRNILQENCKITKKLWLSEVENLQQKSPKFVNELKQLDWQKDIRCILRNMKNKYDKEENHDAYEEMLEDAREKWQNQFIKI